VKKSRNKKKNHNFLKYMNPKNLKKEVNRCGYNFSLKKTLQYLLMIFLGIILFSVLLKVKWQYILTIIAMVTVLYPSVILMIFRNMYEEKKFEDVTAYMEQILYSFKRRGKILIALEDARTLFFDEEKEKQGDLYEAIGRAIEHIQTGVAKGNIYQEAFAIIEEEYGCKRLYKVHDYLIQVETSGGECNEAIDILLTDRKLWMERTYALLREKKNIKTKITIGIGFSFLIIYLAVLMIPADFGITDLFISQIVTTGVIMCNILIWFLGQKSLSGSVIAYGDDTPFSEIEKQYNQVMHGTIKKEKKKFKIAALLLLPVALLAYYRISSLAAILIVAFCVLLVTQPGRQYKSALKKVRKEVEKQFPEWLMALALQMQSNNVHVSVSKSIESAPEILQEELRKLEAEIKMQPNDLQPYINFMKKLDLPDVTSAMKMLYSMATFGFDNNNKQLQALVERNAILIDKAEKMKSEDYLAGVGILVLLPMITGTVKMITDLICVITYLLSMVSGI